ncbi:MAG TPA: PQQ-binding-like beta-propeller repeat protein [Polyangia bacterium]|nr:PQQ-binding-like beta-propeller repeat protein [Polyangia bacterium]
MLGAILATAGCRAESSVCVFGGAPDLGGVDFAGVTAAAASVTQHHHNSSRDGVYVDPAITAAAAASMHIDPTFDAVTDGETYAQPLFVAGGANEKDLVIVATEKNQVTAFDAADGAVVWRVDAGTLGPPANAGDLPCGNVNPVQGIHGTPSIDLQSRSLFFDVLTEGAGKTFKHLIYALSIDDGSVRAGWPIDVAARFPEFQPAPQGARGATIVVGGMVYVPYGGMWGDCGDYHGYVVQAPIADPDSVTDWHTEAPQSGIWAPGGLASDGASIFAATGNSFDGQPFGHQESILRFAPGPAVQDAFTASNWMSLDTNDKDLGGSGPILVDGPAGEKWALAFGKDTNVYLLDREHLGGVGGQIASAQITTDEIIQAGAAYTSPSGTLVVLKGNGAHCPDEVGDLVALRISNATGALALETIWCADQQGTGSPMITTTDGQHDAIVWAVGSEGDNRLHAFDAETGRAIYDGGCATDQMNTVRRFMTPIVAKGRIYVAADNRVYAFRSQ